MSGESNGAGTVVRVGPEPRRAATDVIDLAEIGGALRRGAGWIVGAAILGLAAAGAVLAFAPRRFSSGATVLLRSSSEGGGSLLSRLGVPAELAPASLGSAIKSPLETELQILESRAVLGTVSDSLGLQVRVLSPEGVPPWRLLAPHPYPGSFRKLRLRFERVAGDRYRVTGRDVAGEIAPGRPLATPAGTLQLASGPLPPAFEVQLLDREDALERLTDRVAVEKAGGEVARVGYAAPDSLSAGAVPNAVVAVYLERRRTTDRGVNQHRAEFLEAQVDSVGRQLTAAEAALRAYQESSGVVDPELVGKIDLEAASKVRESLAGNQVESSALEQLLKQVADGTMGARQLAAYPSFLRSAAINEILGQLAKLETELATLRERRTEADPEVVVLRTRGDRKPTASAPSVPSASPPSRPAGSTIDGRGNTGFFGTSAASTWRTSPPSPMAAMRASSSCVCSASAVWPRRRTSRVSRVKLCACTGSALSDASKRAACPSSSVRWRRSDCA